MIKQDYEKLSIIECLRTEEAIEAFVKTAIEMSRDDVTPIHLMDAMATAAKARELLNAKREDRAEAAADFRYDDNPPVSVFDKIARSFGYHVALVPISAGE